MLTSAFPRRCFGAVWQSVPSRFRVEQMGFKLDPSHISFSTLKVHHLLFWALSPVLQVKLNIQPLYGPPSNPLRFSPAVVFSWCLGTRINQLTINYVGQCVAVWEKLSVCLWIWLWLNWHCSSPCSERGFAQRVLQHYCDCVWGRGRQEFALCDFSCKCSTACTVRAREAYWIPSYIQ